MLGDTSYDRVSQSYELTDKSHVKPSIKEVGDDSANDDFQPMLNEQRTAYTTLPPTTQWPHQPATLVEDPRWELLYDLYDIFLMIVAIILIIKTSLCIYAFSIDKMFRGKYLDGVSALTLKLIEFNEQVCVLHCHLQSCHQLITSR